MKLVEKHIIDKNSDLYKAIDDLCFLSKNLYNVGLYSIRQMFFKTGNFLRYEELQKQLQNSKQVDYCALPAKISQQILITLCRNFKSFFRALEEYKKNPKKFNSSPKIPKYKHKTKGRNLVQYPIDAINARLLEKNKVKLSMSDIIISSRQKHIKQARIIPRYGTYKIEIVYEKSPFFFLIDDFGKSFIVKLKSENIISQYLKKNFSKNLLEQISNYNELKQPSKKLIKTIMNKLNCLLKVWLYDNEHFKDVKLSSETKKLLKKIPKSDKLIHLNRLLLQDAYPQEIKKQEKPAPGHDLNIHSVVGIDIGLNNLAAITSNLKDFQFYF